MVTIRRAGLVALVVASALWAAAADARPTAISGRLSARTLITYGCPGPVQVGAPPCEHWSPLAHARVAVTLNGADGKPIPDTKRVAVSDGSGRLALSLAAGRYTLTPLAGSHTHGGPAIRVVIRGGETTVAVVRFLGYPMMV